MLQGLMQPFRNNMFYSESVLVMQSIFILTKCTEILASEPLVTLQQYSCISIRLFAAS
jgi:hypothetical protein